MNKVVKSKITSVRFSEEDWRRLELLATAARRTPTDMIRFLINEEYDNVTGTK